MKKILAFILALVMLGSLIIGCTPAEDPKDDPKQTTGSSSNESTGAKEELAVDHFKGTKLKIAVLKKETDTEADYNNKEIIKMVTEATGIETEWIVIDSSVVNDKLATLLMSDDQPDIYLGFFSTNETMFANNLDNFYDLAEEGLLETYAPNVVRDYDAFPMLWTASTQGDGSIRGLVTGGAVAADATGGATAYYNIRTDWLEKAQMEVPTNADELYAVLKYFKENDMDGDGDPDNEIPMSFANGYWETDLMMLAAPFGIAGNYTWQAHDHYKNIKDGEVVGTVNTEGFRAFIEFFHKLYSEGLLDVEGFSQTADQYKAKKTEGVIGVVHSFGSAAEDVDYTPFLWEGKEGITPMISGLPTRFMGQRGNFAISADSDNVEAALWWWNWMSKDAETKNIAQGGSGYFTIADDGQVYVNPGYAGVSAVDGIHNYCPVLLPGENAMTPYESRSEQLKMRFDFINKYKDTNMNQEGFPIMYADAEAAEERGFIETELYPYIATFTANAIKDGIDDAGWQKHLDDLESYQYSEWLGMWQDMVDEAASRLED